MLNLDFIIIHHLLSLKYVSSCQRNSKYIQPVKFSLNSCDMGNEILMIQPNAILRPTYILPKATYKAILCP